MKLCEFLVDSLTALASGDWAADGRCLAGPIGVGQRFDTLLQNEVARGASSWVSRSSGDPVRVELSVVEIVAYGQPLASLPEGMTARLVLRGEGGEKAVAPSVVLSGEIN